MKMKNLLWLVLAVSMMIGTSGCLFSPDETETPPGGETGLKYPSTPDILMENFQEIYKDMLMDDFRDMLHSDYKTILLPSTLAEWEQGGNPLAEEVFYRDDEVAIHENIFSGNTGLNPQGQSVLPIVSIEIDYMEKVGTWEQIPDSDEHFGGFGGYYALFNVLIYFNSQDQFRFMVQQNVEFYVVPIDDGGRTKWLLLGQRGHELE